MDQHLSWSYQISQVSKKISRGIGILAKLRGNMDVKLLTNIYYCLVFSYLSYGVEAWGSACDSKLLLLNTLQNKAVRILTGNQYFQVYGETPGPLPSADPLFKELKILKFKDILKMNICKFVYLTLSNDSPSPFANWFTYNHQVHNMPHCRVRLFPKLTILMLVLSNQHTPFTSKSTIYLIMGRK